MGKTQEHYQRYNISQKHPHERGEDLERAVLTDLTKETPPRAWGRLLLDQLEMEQGGNTPTSVGKTTIRPRPNASMKKHPHERGEDVNFGSVML